MRLILEYIENKRCEFEQIEFFKEYLCHPEYTTEEKLSWITMKVFFTMCYGDINRFIFKSNLDQQDTMQEELNKHAEEEDFHWQWMLADVEQLGMNEKRSFTDVVRLIWSDEYAASRRLIYAILALYASSTAQHDRFALIEAIEAISITWFKHTQDLKDKSGNELQFFGKKHYALEASHWIKGDDFSSQKINLTQEQRATAEKLIDQIFVLFKNWMNGYAQLAKNLKANNKKINFDEIINKSKKFKYNEKIGDYAS